MTMYFKILNGPEESGVPIAIWKKEKDSHHLELITEDAWSDGVAQQLVQPITEAEYDCLDVVCDIPHIESDGAYHHLGILKVDPKGCITPDDIRDVRIHAVVVDLADATQFVINDE